MKKIRLFSFTLLLCLQGLYAGTCFAASELPQPVITQPTSAQFYRAGTVIHFAGYAAVPEQGNLPASALTWKVTAHYNTHAFVTLGPLTGTDSGSFTIPASGETTANTWYTISLTATDNSGNTSKTETTIYPEKASLTFQSTPTGLPVWVDGIRYNTPAVIPSVVGLERNIKAPLLATSQTKQYALLSGGVEGDKEQTIVTGSAGTSIHLLYEQVMLDTVSVSADAYVQGGMYAGLSQGTENKEYLYARTDPAVAHNEQQIYLTFPLKNYGTVRYAFLQLTGNRNSLYDAHIGLEARATGSEWDENNLTWNNQPETTSDLLDSQDINAAPGQPLTYQWQAGKALKSVVDEHKKEISFQLRCANPTNRTQLEFYSKEASAYGPKLLVVYSRTAQGIVTGLDNKEEDQTNYVLSPNPVVATDAVRISSAKEKILSAEIRSSDGTLQPQARYNQSEGGFSANGLQAGTYMVQLQTTEGTVSRKLVVR